MPFVKASQVRHFYEDAEIASYDDAVRVILEHTEIDPAQRNVLVAHQFVVGGGQAPTLGGSESVNTQTVGLVEQISCRCFDLFDYVALGHIHSAQAVGRETVRYAGSPLKYSLSEVDHTKYATLITLGAKGQVDIRLEPLTPLRELRHLKGPMKKLLENVTDPDDFIYATLTDEDPIDNVMNVFQRYYPRTLRIDFEQKGKGNPDEGDPVDYPLPNMGFDEILGQFYRRFYGEDIPEEEMHLMREAAKEAGILHETD